MSASPSPSLPPSSWSPAPDSYAAHEEPESSPIGIAYLFVTAVVMFSLARWKRRVGAALDSDPFRAEASMTFLDGCLATSILTALALNLLFGWWWADPAAALLIGAVAAREARDSWREARDLDPNNACAATLD